MQRDRNPTLGVSEDTNAQKRIYTLNPRSSSSSSIGMEEMNQRRRGRTTTVTTKKEQV
jgi:hypothetical protein